MHSFEKDKQSHSYLFKHITKQIHPKVTYLFFNNNFQNIKVEFFCHIH